MLAPSSTSFGALQTFSVANGAIKDFAATLVGYGDLTKSTASGIQNLSWAGQLAAGTYTVQVTGLTLVKNVQYVGTVSALPVPEPETYGMLLGGLALVGAVARRRAKKAD
ncbi:PEP-CTERM motif protein [compost metagenome]